MSSLTEEELESLAKRAKESKQPGTQKQYATQLKKWEVRPLIAYNSSLEGSYSLLCIFRLSLELRSFKAWIVFVQLFSSHHVLMWLLMFNKS